MLMFTAHLRERESTISGGWGRARKRKEVGPSAEAGVLENVGGRPPESHMCRTPYAPALELDRLRLVNVAEPEQHVLPRAEIGEELQALVTEQVL